jgi:prepilin-type N-terminal cleavage/methylation domain-containing protein
MKKAFTLVELLIVISVLGIIAALVIPEMKGHAAKTKETAAKDNLRILRNAIEIYAAQHNGIPPGYSGGSVSLTAFVNQLCLASDAGGGTAAPGTPGFDYGPYLPDIPDNSFNDLSDVTMLADAAGFPAEAPGTSGWIYKPATKDIRIDYPGTDSIGDTYYEY